MTNVENAKIYARSGHKALSPAASAAKPRLGGHEAGYRRLIALSNLFAAVKMKKKFVQNVDQLYLFLH